MEIYLVGGAVRDQLLGLPVKEKDWLVVGATPAQMLEQGFRPVGKDFPVFLHPDTKEEYALARTERKTAPGYQGFHFHADESVSLEQDLLRRDLTINAIVKDAEGNIVDPLNGKQDIEQRCLRHVSDAFSEDPVRVLRTARFLARFTCLGFRIADSTLQLMQAMVATGETKHLVAERVWQECDKALGERNPEVFLQVLHTCGALADVAPEYQSPLIDQAIQNLQMICDHSQSRPLRFAAMVYCLPIESIQSLCDRLSVPNVYRELAELLKTSAKQLVQTQSLDAVTVMQLIQQLDAHRKKERFELILDGANILQKTDSLNSIRSFWESVISAFIEVDPQVFIQQGLTKAALGKAIKQQRLQNIQALLANT